MDLHRKGSHIVDIETSTVYTKGSSVTFNFDNMYLYNNNAKTQKKPIRYDGENLLCWTSGKWKNWPDKDTQDAINFLFHIYMEHQLL